MSYATINSLKQKLSELNALLDVKIGDVGYCYLSSITVSPRKRLYQVYYIKDDIGTVENFLGTGKVSGNQLSLCISTFIKGFKQRELREKESKIFNPPVSSIINKKQVFKQEEKMINYLGHLINDTMERPGVLIGLEDANADILYIDNKSQKFCINTLPLSGILKSLGYDYEWRKPLIDVIHLQAILEN